MTLSRIDCVSIDDDEDVSIDEDGADEDDEGNMTGRTGFVSLASDSLEFGDAMMEETN